MKPKVLILCAEDMVDYGEILCTHMDHLFDYTLPQSILSGDPERLLREGLNQIEANSIVVVIASPELFGSPELTQLAQATITAKKFVPLLVRPFKKAPDWFPLSEAISISGRLFEINGRKTAEFLSYLLSLSG